MKHLKRKSAWIHPSQIPPKRCESVTKERGNSPKLEFENCLAGRRSATPWIAGKMATEVADRTDQQKKKEIGEIDMKKKHDSRKTSQGWSLPLPSRRSTSSSPETVGEMRRNQRGWEEGRGFGVVCEGGPAAPTTASSAALRRLWRRGLRREEREIETEGWGRRGDVGWEGVSELSVYIVKGEGVFG